LRWISIKLGIGIIALIREKSNRLRYGFTASFCNLLLLGGGGGGGAEGRPSHFGTQHSAFSNHFNQPQAEDTLQH